MLKKEALELLKKRDCSIKDLNAELLALKTKNDELMRENGKLINDMDDLRSRSWWDRLLG